MTTAFKTIQESSSVPQQERPRVLHIVEALGGGVMVAVRTYIRSTEQAFDHVVLGRHRKGHDTGDIHDTHVLDLAATSQPLLQAQQVRNAVREISPDVVHLHSSLAGVLGRIAIPPGPAIIYTPHCFAFERRDVSPLSRSAFRRVETILRKRATAIVAVSPHEAELAKQIIGHPNVYYVPNSAEVLATPNPWCPEPAIRRPLNVVTAGRIAAQKDPAWFAEFAAHLLAIRPDTQVTWLGEGYSEDEQRLRNAGVTVTGWMPRSDILAALQRSNVYVHSAAWEGAPLTVLEALAYGLPVYARNIASLRSLGLVNLFATPLDAAQAVSTLTSDELRRQAKRSMDLSLEFTLSRQRAALSAAYQQAMQLRRSS